MPVAAQVNHRETPSASGLEETKHGNCIVVQYGFQFFKTQVNNQTTTITKNDRINFQSRRIKFEILDSNIYIYSFFLYYFIYF